MEKLDEFATFQDCYNEIKPCFKIIRCTKVLPEVESVDEAKELILKEHIRLNHRGSNNVFLVLKSKYFIPNFASMVNAVINACDTCNISKYERKP